MEEATGAPSSIRGLTSEAAAGFQSRRGLNHDDSAPVTPHNAPFPTYKAARVHHAARRCGRVAARGARAGRADAAHWRAHEPGLGRCGRTGSQRGVPTGPAGVGLDRRPQRADRVSLGAGDAELFRRHASELVALAPDVILAGGGAVVPSLLQATRTVPIVFTGTPDPVGAGFVESLARPGGQRHRIYSIPRIRHQR